MPFYEYECQACKYYIEVMQKITDAPLTKCPSCGKRKLRKLVSAPVFRLKGAGWYETDFKGDKENKRNLVGADKEEAKSDAQGVQRAQRVQGLKGIQGLEGVQSAAAQVAAQQAEGSRSQGGPQRSALKMRC